MGLGRESLTLQIGALVRAGTGFVGVAWLSHALGPREQGEYYSAVAAFSLLYVLGTAGIGSLVVSRIAESEGRLDEVAAWVRFLLLSSAAVSLVLAGIGWLLRDQVTIWLELPPQVGEWFSLLCWTPLLELFRIAAVAALHGLRRMRALVLLESFSEVLRVACVIGGAYATGGAAGSVLGWLIASLLSSVFAMWVWGAQEARGATLPAWSTVVRGPGFVPERKDLVDAVSLGFIRNSSAVSRDALPALLTARFAGAEWVAYLRIGQRIISVGQLFAAGASRISLPLLGELASRPEALKRAWLRASLVGAGSVGLSLLALLALLPVVLDLFLDSAYREPVLRTCYLIAPAVLLSGFAVASDAFYLATRTVRAGLWITLLGLPWGLVVLFVTTRADPHFGAAWGLSLASVWVLWHPLYAWRWFSRSLNPEASPDRYS